MAARTGAQSTWDAAIQALSDAQGALTAALGTNDLAALRQTVEDDTAAWSAQNDALDGKVQDVLDADNALKAAMGAQADATLACEIAAYDAYRTALEAEQVQRLEDLATIKALLEA
jgi:hypothetical protein